MSTRVRFLKQWTTTTRSDHDALFVDVMLIRRRLGRVKTALLRLCTQNAGGHFGPDDLRKLLRQEPHVLALQECSDQPWMAEVAAEFGYVQLVGEPSGQVGQPATPTFVSAAEVRVRRPGKWVRLLGAARIGKGAGHDTSKPKWWLRTWLAIEGIPFSASSWHATTSQQFAGRFAAALTEARVWLSIAATLRRPVFTLGDTNSDLQQRLTRWILAHGMTSNHEQLGELATMRKRSIDAVNVQRHLVVKARAVA